MAESKPFDGSSTSNVCGGSSESTLQLNVKTLDSKIYSFCVEKNVMSYIFCDYSAEKFNSRCRIREALDAYSLFLHSKCAILSFSK